MLAYEYINMIEKSENENEIRELIKKAQKDITVSDLDFLSVLYEYRKRKSELEVKA